MAQELYELPQGWEWKELNSICEKTENIAPNKTPSVQFNYVDISAIDREKHIIAEVKEILGKDAPSRAKKEIKPNDILFATTRPNLKNIAIYDTYLERPVASTGFCILRCKQGTSHNYIFRFLLTDHLQNQISDFISGAQYPAITDKNLKRSKIPVPPLAEQERIVAKLDALFSRIDQAIAQLQHTQSQTKALFASALDQSFQKNKDRERIGDFCLVKGGKRLPKGKKLLEEETEYPYIRVADFTDNGTIDLSGIKYITKEIHEQISRYIISAKDLYISIAGTIGKTGIIPKELDGANLTENAAKLVIKDRSKVELRYFYLFTLSSDFTTQAGLATKVVAQPKLALTRLSDIQVPLPPLAEQSKIVAQLDAISERTQALTTATSAQLEKLKALKASLLDAAFRGQLPSDQ